MSRKKKGRDIRDAAYKEEKTLANYLESKLSLTYNDVKKSEHYKLLVQIDCELKEIRKDYRIRTAKDKTRREKEALKKLAQLESDNETEMKQVDGAEQTPQAKPSTRPITETLQHPSTNKSLTQKIILAPSRFIKQKSAKAKSKMSRRKIKRMLG